jgi:hydrogenase small subunit
MTKLTRRSFLQLSARLSAVMGLGASAIPQMAVALEEMAFGKTPVLWLQGQSCSGCSVSLLDAEAPAPAKLLTRYISLVFHQTLSAVTGHEALEIINKTAAQGDFILCVEGSVPAGMPQACTFAEEPFTTLLSRVAQKAKAVVAVGTCASYGGVPCAENNPTGATSVSSYIKSSNIATPIILVPGCPAHPEWLLGTLAHVLKFGLPPLDAQNRPKAFFDRLVHDQCPRFADYERENFASKFGDEGCLFKLGCVGPITKADCNVRLWNGGVNTCIRAHAPCIGCAGAQFVAKTDFPLLTKNRPKDLKAKD